MSLTKVAESFTNKTDLLCMQFKRVADKDIATLVNALDDLIVKYIKDADEANADGRYAYHHGGHAAEMGFDAAAAMKIGMHFFEGDKVRAELYVKLLQAMHAGHDLIQGKGAPTNEIESANIFKRDFAEIIKNSGLVVPGKTKEAIDLMADTVIVQGTVFNFNKMQSTAVVTFLEGSVISGCGSITAATILTSLNDTTRMAFAQKMIENNAYAPFLREQYNELKDNLLVKNLLATDFKPRTATASKGRKNEFLTGAALYTHTRRSLKKSSYGDLSANELAPVFSFMHIVGQNIRIICELDQKSAPIVDIFKKFIKTGKTVELSPELVNQAFDFMLLKIKNELIEGGFCDKMRWVENGIDKLNREFGKQFGINFNLLDAQYKNVWRDYITNVNTVLKNVETQAVNMTGEEQAKFKKQFVLDCMSIGRNQIGLFIKRDNALSAALKAPKLH